MKRYSTWLATGKCKLKPHVVSLHTSMWLVKIKIVIPNAGEDVKKLDQSYIAVWIVWVAVCKRYSHSGKSRVVSYKNIRVYHTTQQCPFEHLSQKMKTYVHIKTCTWMFIAALLVRAKNWKQLLCPLVGEWLSKLWYIHTMEYYSAIKRNCPDFTTMQHMHVRNLYIPLNI